MLFHCAREMPERMKAASTGKSTGVRTTFEGAAVANCSWMLSWMICESARVGDFQRH